MQTPHLPIETERLLLRSFVPEDAQRYYSYRSLPETVRYLYREPMTLDDAIERMPRYADHTFVKDDDVFTLAVQPKDAEELAGEVLLMYRNARALQAELGYSLHPDAVGRGYMTEAATAMVRLGFEHFGLHRIYARIDSENTASVRLAERLGMRREAHLIENDFFDGRWGSEYVYAILAVDGKS